jgi:large subunit ribosomal protein L23
MEAHDIIKNPVSTEKSIRLMEAENKIIFVIDRRAKKQDVAKAIEKMFKAKITKVNTHITSKGEKRAIVRFADETPAIDIATQLGMM